MGCASSKIDDLGAVVLCRERLGYIDDALRRRYALAEAHMAYIESLKSVGASLHGVFDAAATAGVNVSAVPGSPVLNLPPHRKGDPEEGNESPSGHLSLSNSGSHLHFQSDSDEELHHLHSDSPPHQRMLPLQDDGYQVQENIAPYSGVYMHMNYMKKQATPSVSYEWRPMSPENVQMAESSYHYPYYSNYQNANSSYANYYDGGGNSYAYMNQGGGGGGGGMGGFFGSSPPRGYSFPPRQVGAASPSSSKPPPPPPPPPATSTWDFLNPFDSIEASYPPYTPSRDSREVREEEGIPDLEDEDYQQEVVKEVHGDQKFVDGVGSSGGSSSGTRGKNLSRELEEKEEEMGGAGDGVSQYQIRPSVAVDHDPVEYEVHMVDKKVVGKEGRAEEAGNVGAFKGRPVPRSAAEAVKEIQVQFERASASGSELAKILETGKLRYQRKNAAYQVSSKMLHAITPSLPSTSKDGEAPAVDLDEDARLRSRNLSSTLQKLYLWEKKLLDEVKAEEKMRVMHDKKLQKLKRMDERGAEAHKIDATRTLVRSLSTKIRMAIQVVDRTSVTINKLRDEELWPQLNELIQGLARMWKAMLECHHCQCQAVDGAKGLDAIVFPNNPSDAHLEATKQLANDLINWTKRFSDWVTAQKSYVKALNSWLFKCLFYEPEETPDGIAPYSPGRAGAPPVFVICNQWCQALEIISEKEVVDSMRVFTMMVWERDKVEMQQRMMASKDMERKDMKIQKEIQAMDKKMILVYGDATGLSMSGNVVYQSDTSSKSNLQNGLRHIFEAMNRFTAESVKAYEELLMRGEEYVREHGSS
ncbi:hypothetical protein Ancab_017262 [Ancistrocladus abbreviatus]